MMREGRTGEKTFKISQCPRTSGVVVGKSATDNCPALELVEAGEGGEEFLEETVSALFWLPGFSLGRASRRGVDGVRVEKAQGAGGNLRLGKSLRRVRGGLG